MSLDRYKLPLSVVARTLGCRIIDILPNSNTEPDIQRWFISTINLKKNLAKRGKYEISYPKIPDKNITPEISLPADEKFSYYQKDNQLAIIDNIEDVMDVNREKPPYDDDIEVVDDWIAKHIDGARPADIEELMADDNSVENVFNSQSLYTKLKEFTDKIKSKFEISHPEDMFQEGNRYTKADYRGIFILTKKFQKIKHSNHISAINDIDHLKEFNRTINANNVNRDKSYVGEDVDFYNHDFDKVVAEYIDRDKDAKLQLSPTQYQEMLNLVAKTTFIADKAPHDETINPKELIKKLASKGIFKQDYAGAGNWKDAFLTEKNLVDTKLGGTTNYYIQQRLRETPIFLQKAVYEYTITFIPLVELLNATADEPYYNSTHDVEIIRHTGQPIETYRNPNLFGNSKVKPQIQKEKGLKMEIYTDQYRNGNIFYACFGNMVQSVESQRCLYDNVSRKKIKDGVYLYNADGNIKSEVKKMSVEKAIEQNLIFLSADAANNYLNKYASVENNEEALNKRQEAIRKQEEDVEKTRKANVDTLQTVNNMYEKFNIEKMKNSVENIDNKTKYEIKSFIDKIDKKIEKTTTKESSWETFGKIAAATTAFATAVGAILALGPKIGIGAGVAKISSFAFNAFKAVKPVFSGFFQPVIKAGIGLIKNLTGVFSKLLCF